MKRKIVQSICLLIILVFFVSCGKELSKPDEGLSITEPEENTENIEKLDTNVDENAIGTVIDLLQVDQNEILSPDIVYSLKDLNILDNDECSISQIAYEDSLYCAVEYAHDGAQYSYRYDIYDLSAEKPKLLYTTQEAIWLNEFNAYMGKLFWIEFIPMDGDRTYRLIQFDPKNSEIYSIAEYSSMDVYEISLSVGGGIVAWYEDSDDYTALKYYDIEAQTITSVDSEQISLFSPYDRLGITDDMLAYTTKDDDGNIFCVHKSITKGTEEEILLKAYDSHEEDPYECVSNEKYCVWFSFYDKGNHYFYDINGKTLGNVVFPEQCYLFSLAVYSDHIYLNIRGDKGGLYDISKGRVCRYEYPENVVGMHFYKNKYGDYFKLESDEQIFIKLLY